MYTLGELMQLYYGKSGQVVCGVLSLLICGLCVAMQIAVFGYMGHAFFGINQTTAALFSAVVIIIYCYFGGIRAVVTTDVIQIVIILVVFPFLCYFALDNFGGIDLLMSQVSQSKLTNISSHPKLYHYIIMAIIFAIPEFDPAEFHRLIIAKTAFRIKRSMKMAAFISLVFFAMITLLTSVVYIANPDIASNEALLFTIVNYVPNNVAVAGYIAIIAVVMSTTDSYLNSGSIIATKDIIEPVFGKFASNQAKIKTAKLLTLVIGSLACYLALSAESIMELVYKFVYLWFPTIVVPIYTCVFNYRASSTMFKAMLCGVATFLLWQHFNLEQSTYLIPALPCLVANMLAFMLLRKLELYTKFNNIAAHTNKLFNEVSALNLQTNLLGVHSPIVTNCKYNGKDVQALAKKLHQLKQTTYILESVIQKINKHESRLRQYYENEEADQVKEEA
ncbi:MAG: sodium:solute symporter family protein [Pseudomonadota bacterium]